MSRRAGGGAGGERGSVAQRGATGRGRASAGAAAHHRRRWSESSGSSDFLTACFQRPAWRGTRGGDCSSRWLGAGAFGRAAGAAHPGRNRRKAPAQGSPGEPAAPAALPGWGCQPLPACSEQRGRLTHIPQVGRRLGVALVLVMDALPRGGIVQASGVARPRRRIAKMAALAGPLRSRVRARRARQASGEGDRQASSPHERPADCRAARGSHSPQFPASPGAAGRRAVRWGWRGCAVPVDRRSAEPICFGLQQGLHATKSAAMLATSVSAVRPFSVPGSVRAASGVAGAAQPRGSVGSARES